MRPHLELLAVALAFVFGWIGINSIALHSVDLSSKLHPGMVVAAAPDGKPDVLADSVLTLCLLAGSITMGYVYYAGKMIKDKIFSTQDGHYRFYFLSGAVILGFGLGLAATKTLTIEIDRSWAFICGGGGALTSWGAYDLILAALLKKAQGWFGGGTGEQAALRRNGEKTPPQGTKVP